MNNIFKSVLPDIEESSHKLRIVSVVPMDELMKRLSNIVFRGVYDADGNSIKPYSDIQFTLETIYPPETAAALPQVSIGYSKLPLYTSQPTLYDVQSQVIKTLYEFLKKEGHDLFNLDCLIEYEWEGRGKFHVMPPIVERHVYALEGGFFDLDAIAKRFKGFYVKDARHSTHELSEQMMSDFYIDDISRIPSMHVFNPNIEIMNYGLSSYGEWKVNVICDGSHRVDYALEYMNKPIRALVIEGRNQPLAPYYAMPVPFRPSIRLSSKRSEVIYPELARDKVHLLNSYISKVLHYDWEVAGLNISSLRLKKDIY